MATLPAAPDTAVTDRSKKGGSHERLGRVGVKGPYCSQLCSQVARPCLTPAPPGRTITATGSEVAPPQWCTPFWQRGFAVRLLSEQLDDYYVTVPARPAAPVDTRPAQAQNRGARTHVLVPLASGRRAQANVDINGLSFHLSCLFSFPSSFPSSYLPSSLPCFYLLPFLDPSLSFCGQS